MQRISIGEAESGQRLDKFLLRYLPAASNGFLHRMLRKKNIVLNETKAVGSELLRPGDVISLWFSEETWEKLRGQMPAVDLSVALDPACILYEDEDLLVVNKPAGLLSQKSKPEDVSLVEQIRAYLVKSGQQETEDFRLYAPGVANRLDRNTSGLVLSPKNLSAARRLAELLAARRITKYYLALVQGDLRNERTIQSGLFRDAANNRSIVVPQGTAGAQTIRTAISPLVRTGDYSLLRVQLITGKSHQIRAQLAAEGYPLLGDPKYGKGATANGADRQMLHARELHFPAVPAFSEPLAGKNLTAPLPEDMRRVLTACHIDWTTL